MWAVKGPREGGREGGRSVKSSEDYSSCSYLVDNAASHSHPIQNGDLHISMVHISLWESVKYETTYIDDDRGSPIVHWLGAVGPEVGALSEINVTGAEAAEERGGPNKDIKRPPPTSAIAN